MEVISEMLIQDVSNKAKDIQEQYDYKYAKKNEMERLLATLREQKVKNLQEVETCLRMKLENVECSYKIKIQDLHEKLDNATLQYSHKMLNFTKLDKEKRELEAYVNNFKVKEEGFRKQVNDLKHDFELIKETFQKQVTNYDKQRAELQLKISELETANAKLLNKCLRLQTKEERGQPFTAPKSHNSRILEMYLSKNPYIKGQNSDMTAGCGLGSQKCILCENSSRNKENLLTSGQRRALSVLVNESVSDRFSSLKALNSARIHFQPLEISQTKNNMLEKEKSCGDQYCKIKTTEKIHLNGKLKHYNKLLQGTYILVANKHKREVEMKISKEIHITKAKVNLEISDSDSQMD